VTVRILRRLLRALRLQRCGSGSPNAARDSLVAKAAWFVVGNQMKGDYLEFGVFRGATFIRAYHTIKEVYAVASGDDMVGAGHTTPGEAEWLRAQWRQMRFFAFDSFRGLPDEVGTGAPAFVAGKYSCGEEEFRANLRRAQVPVDRVETVPGWYADSLTAETRERHGGRPAAIVFVDCDLYSSTTSVLEYVTPLLQEGTVLVFDDWYHYRGDPGSGEQRAAGEWAQRTLRWKLVEYHKEGAFRNSFIVVKA
jgi:hypothetical protein